MSPEREPATGIMEQEAPAVGAEHADQLLNEHANKAGTVGEVRSNVQSVLIAVKGDQEAEARVKEYVSALRESSEGHDSVKLREMSGGQQGQNQVGTHNSEANDDLFEAENLINHTEVTTEVLDHEDDESSGHAGQIAGREGLVNSKGDVVEGEEMYEGENETKQSLRQRGSANARRAGQPADVYGSGQDKVAPNIDVFSDYLRNGKERVEAQAELLRGQNRTEIIRVLSDSNQYDQREITQIVQLAA